MKSSRPGCDATRLQGLLDDTLPESEESDVVDHLGGCEACQRRIEDLAAAGAWWENLRRFAPRASARAGGLHPNPIRTGPASRAEASLGFLAPSDDPRFVGRLGRYEVTGIHAVGSSIELRFRNGHGKIVTGRSGTTTGVGSRSSRICFVG